MGGGEDIGIRVSSCRPDHDAVEILTLYIVDILVPTAKGLPYSKSWSATPC